MESKSSGSNVTVTFHVFLSFFLSLRENPHLNYQRGTKERPELKPAYVLEYHLKWPPGHYLHARAIGYQQARRFNARERHGSALSNSAPSLW